MGSRKIPYPSLGGKMEQSIYKILTSSSSSQLIINLIIIIIIFFIVLIVKNYIRSFFNYLQFRLSMNLSNGDCLLMSYGFEFVEVQIVKVTLKYIILESEDVKIIVPMSSFTSRDWIISKKIKT